MNDTTKLPRWAQDHISTLERQRDTAVRELKEWADSQTPSPVSIEEFVSDGKKQGPTVYTRYVNTRSLHISWEGIELDIGLRKDSTQHENGITLQWTASNRHSGHVAFVPTSFQYASLIAKENMR